MVQAAIPANSPFTPPRPVELAGAAWIAKLDRPLAGNEKRCRSPD